MFEPKKRKTSEDIKLNIFMMLIGGFLFFIASTFDDAGDGWEGFLVLILVLLGFGLIVGGIADLFSNN